MIMVAEVAVQRYLSCKKPENWGTFAFSDMDLAISESHDLLYAHIFNIRSHLLPHGSTERSYSLTPAFRFPLFLREERTKVAKLVPPDKVLSKDQSLPAPEGVAFNFWRPERLSGA
jgi:hypothetical protein